MSSNIPRFVNQSAPLAPEAVASAEPAEPPPPPSLMPASKRPPPLPKGALLVPLSDDSPSVEQLFFREGIDGHAESVPPSGRYPFPLSGNGPVAGAESESTRAARSTIPPTSLDDEWLDLDEDVEDPARTRRRRAARIATAWGTIAAIAVVGAALFMSPRRDLRSATASSSSVTVETVARPAVSPSTPAAPTSQGHAPATEVAPQGGSSAAIASASSATAPQNPRTARTSASSSPVARPASAAPRAASARATRARHPQPVRSTAKASVHAPASTGTH